MPTCRADPTIERLAVGDFKFPLGVYPVEPAEPRAGYIMEFEPADGGSIGIPGVEPQTDPTDSDDEGEGEWEAWPDRYVFDIVISADRLEPLCRRLFSLLPGRVYPILDVLGRDAFREIDPYISYELLGLDRFLDSIRQYRDFFYEDGLCGFGAMSESPFVYVFIDEHKIATVRVEPALKERLEKILASFDLVQAPAEHEPAGADSAAHEHRSVLLVPDDAPNLLGPDEIVEELREDWHLLLNVNPETNLDEEGRPLGTTPWRAVVRCELQPKAKRQEPRRRYAEVILYADNLHEAEETALDAVDGLCTATEKQADFGEIVVVSVDRLSPDMLEQMPDQDSPRKAGRKAGSKGGSKSKKDREEADAPAKGKSKGRRAATPVPEAGTVQSCRWIEP